MKKILVPLSGRDSDNIALETALSIARRFGSHIEVLHVRPDAERTLPYIGETVSGPLIEEIIDKLDADADSAAKGADEAFEAWRGKAGIAAATAPGNDGPTCEFVACHGGRDAMIAARARTADLTIFRAPGANDTPGAYADVEAALMASGRPLMLAPDKLDEALASKVVVAWNDSVESARAVAAAMPFIEGADAVTVIAVREDKDAQVDLDGIRNHLAWHGVEATTDVVDAKDRIVGDVLMERAARHKGALLVMGGYTHSRLREQVFGGVTQDILELSEVPVLMVH